MTFMYRWDWEKAVIDNLWITNVQGIWLTVWKNFSHSKCLKVEVSLLEKNKVKILFGCCTVTNIYSSKVILIARRWNNMYGVDFESIPNDDLICLGD